MAYDHRVFNLRGRDVHSFSGVQQGDLNQGTGTNQNVRDHVNTGQGIPAEVSSSWAAGPESGNSTFQNTPSTTASGRWHAGHMLARQNGGLGDVTSEVFPQNAQINMGNSLNGQPTYDQWRGQEQNFHNAVGQHGQGDWTVTLRDQPRTPYV